MRGGRRRRVRGRAGIVPERRSPRRRWCVVLGISAEGLFGVAKPHRSATFDRATGRGATLSRMDRSSGPEIASPVRMRPTKIAYGA